MTNTTPDTFDPYNEWLGIPPDKQPPSYYDLLGVAVDETDEKRIRQAMAQRYEHVRTYGLGPQAKHVDRILAELAEALNCLTDPGQREQYNRRLVEESRLPATALSQPSGQAPGSTAPELPAVEPAAEPKGERVDAVSLLRQLPATDAEGPQEADFTIGLPTLHQRRRRRERGSSITGAVTPALRAVDKLLGVMAGGENTILHNFLRCSAGFVVLGAVTATWILLTSPQAADSTEGETNPSVAAAVYEVAVEPADARLAVSSKLATVIGEGTARKITIAEPDGETKMLVLAVLDGYQSAEHEIQPKPGELGSLTFHLEPLPAPPAPAATSLVAGLDTSDSRPSTAPVGEPGPKDLPDSCTNSISMEFVLIPAGEFMMGSPDSDADADDNEQPQHRVKISKPFYLGIYEVTQEQYERVMGENPSWFSGDPSLPVEQVSWKDAQEFCRRLSALAEESTAGCAYRLPTEAEWEYACRAGSTTRYCFGDSVEDLGEYGWFWGSKTQPVGQKKPNGWGLYDMHGNVWEWCADWYDQNYYGNSPASDPTGPSSSSVRVYRGGGWNYGARGCRSANRDIILPGGEYNYLGFRACLVPADESSR